MGQVLDEFLEWCEGKWDKEAKIDKLTSKLSYEDLNTLEAIIKEHKISMLNELEADIRKIPSLEHECDYAIDECIYRYKVADLIEEKINMLKGE